LLEVIVNAWVPVAIVVNPVNIVFITLKFCVEDAVGDATVAEDGTIETSPVALIDIPPVPVTRARELAPVALPMVVAEAVPPVPILTTGVESIVTDVTALNSKVESEEKLIKPPMLEAIIMPPLPEFMTTPVAPKSLPIVTTAPVALPKVLFPVTVNVVNDPAAPEISVHDALLDTTEVKIQAALIVLLTQTVPSWALSVVNGDRKEMIGLGKIFDNG
jgi:hypothetical protein